MSYCPTCGLQIPANRSTCTGCESTQSNHDTTLDITSDNRATAFRVLAVVGLASGIFFVLTGLIWLLQQFNLIPQTVQIWPFAAIIFGSLILTGAVKGIRYTR
jgi:hypothetical protein